MKKWYITLSLMAFSFTMNAQQTEIQMVNSTHEDSVTINLNVDFATLLGFVCLHSQIDCINNTGDVVFQSEQPV